MKRASSSMEIRGRTLRRSDASFAARLAQIIAEYGSRYALSKASEIPASTLQGYAHGSKPGMDQLATLARVANVDLAWLLTGKGQMRGVGQLPGAALADVIMVDEYDPKSSLLIPTLVNQLPFSRHYLETTLRLNQPSHDSLLAIQSAWNLLDLLRGDLLLIDRKQAGLTLDGVYLLALPGFVARGVFARPNGKLTVIEPRARHASTSTGLRGGGQEEWPDSYQVDRLELLGNERNSASKVVGRVVWIGRPL